MSIESNIELVKRHFQNEVRGDSAAILAEMTDDCHYFMYPPVDEQITDKKTITDIHDGLSSAFSAMNIDIEDVVASDDTVAARVVLGGRQTGAWDGIPPTGKAIYLRTAAYFKFRDNKVINESIYCDRREILR